MVWLPVCGSAKCLHVLYRSRWASARNRSGSAGVDCSRGDGLGPLSHELDSCADGGIGIRGFSPEPADSETHLAPSQSSGGSVAAGAGVSTEDKDGAIAVCASDDHAVSDQPRRGHALQDFPSVLRDGADQRSSIISAVHSRSYEQELPDFQRCPSGMSSRMLESRGMQPYDNWKRPRLEWVERRY